MRNDQFVLGAAVAAALIAVAHSAAFVLLHNAEARGFLAAGAVMYAAIAVTLTIRLRKRTGPRR